MNTSEKVLVILLSAALAVFLVLACIVLVKVIQIMDRIKTLTEKAEEIADKAEAVGDFFQKTAGPATFVKAFARMARPYKDKK